MSDITTIYAYFSAIDFKGENVLSSFALPATPLRFVTDFASDTRTKILWNFGDGTTADTLTALKYYDFPGKYNVNLVVYDCYDNAQISTFTKKVEIHDYFPFTFKLSPDTDITSSNGVIIGPWIVTSFYPPYQPVSSIFYTISGSSSKNYWSVYNEKFDHLEPFHTLYQQVYNYKLSSFQYEEINRIDFTGVPVYGVIENGNIVPCLSSIQGSFFIGTSAQKEIFFRDDEVSSLVSIKFQFDKNNNYLKSEYKSNPQDYINNLGITLSAKVEENTNIDRLSITSNGIDGEGFPITSFDICPLKYYNTDIPFVVKIKDGGNFSIKNFDKLALSSLNVTVSGSSLSAWSYDVFSLNETLSAQGSGGAFRGYLTFTGTTPITGVQIITDGTFTNHLSSSFTISGRSSLFSVYPKDYYGLYKQNENFDAKETLKSLRFQEILLDKTVLFDEFFGTIFGDADSSYDTIGKKTYEKIANFVANNVDVDVSETEQLYSMIQMMGATYENLGNIPENIKRFLNLFSIDKNRLFGTSNKFKENFDIRGRTSKDEYGVNLGNQINNSTYVISAGVPIVALEKFSNQYTLLNTYQPLSVAGWTYQLSAYSPDWGWPLVLPSGFTPDKFPEYYIFFEYVDQYDDRLRGGVIDFSNTLTTVLSTTSYDQLFGDWGIVEQVFGNTLYDSLSLYH